MKVCLISPYPPLPHGISFYTQKLVEALKKISKSVMVTIIANSNALDALGANSRVDLKRVWRENDVFTPMKIYLALIKEKPTIAHIQYEFNIFGQRPYTPIFLPILLLFLRVGLFRVKRVVTFHCVPDFRKLSADVSKRYRLKMPICLVKLFLIVMMKVSYILSDIVIVHTPLSKVCLVEAYGMCPKKILVIPHPIPVTNGIDFNKEKVKRRLGIKSTHLLLTFGFQQRGKGLFKLAEAFENILKRGIDATLVIAGGWRDKQYLEETQGWARELRDRVIITGFIRENTLKELMAIADCCVFFYEYGEATYSASGPLSYAIAFEKPVIATAIPQFAEEIKNGFNGILIPPRDVNSLFKALFLLFSDNKLAQKLGKNIGIKKVNRSYEDIALKTLKIYEAPRVRCRNEKYR